MNDEIKEATAPVLTFLEFLGLLLLCVVIEIPVMMLYGLIISDLWMWFVTPITAIVIGKAHACGIWIFISFLTKHKIDTKSNDFGVKFIFDKAIYRCIYVLLVWAFGSILVCLM